MSKILRIDTSPSVVIQALNEAIKAKYPFIKSIVFSADQSYEDSITAGRTIDYSIWQGKAKHLNSEDKMLLPMLSWTRSILQQSSTGLGRKFIAHETLPTPNDDLQAKAFIGELQYEFNIYTTNMNDIERFEIDWYTGKGLRDTFVTIKVNLGQEIGIFSYSLIWERDLSSIVWSLEGNYYKSVSGSAKISGTFASIEQVNKHLGRIYEYNLQIVDCNGRTLYENTVEVDPKTREIIKDVIESP